MAKRCMFYKANGRIFTSNETNCIDVSEKNKRLAIKEMRQIIVMNDFDYINDDISAYEEEIEIVIGTSIRTINCFTTNGMFNTIMSYVTVNNIESIGTGFYESNLIIFDEKLYDFIENELLQ